MEQTSKLVQTIVEGIQEKKGSGIVIADLSGIDGTICKNFIICQGNSPAQVEAIAESVGDMARKQLGEKPAHVVGLENAQWVAMDYTDVLVHVFLPDVRAYYDLEHLWADAPLTAIPDLD
ncbi:ribosome silencing factor [Prevotella sp. E13-17]|uniref:ribosome silencing factor n=1 Tax=Prevotella sp. E13-17 TaxID=2913616 RepID=UPI001ED9F935|nr:ribosome silencing factor [Prevotella sp. E13-17]UKK51781.1 ribosome silencing factor [Prevotella sp. E13-17]